MPVEKIKQLVVDTTAFLRNEQLQNVADNMMTVQGVVDEIKNDKQLARLVVLPYNLKIREPFPENLKFVTEFAKKTGDYATLSLTDLTVMALTYELEKQEFGVEHLRTSPIVAKTVYSSSKPKPEGFESHGLPGFYVSKDKPEAKEYELETEMTEAELTERIAQLSCEPESEGSEEILVKVDEQPEQEEFEHDEEYEVVEESSEEEEDDDEEGWITPSNIKSLKSNFGPQTYSEVVPAVACMTSDFAMQNVLKQIGLQVAALDGRVIKFNHFL